MGLFGEMPPLWQDLPIEQSFLILPKVPSRKAPIFVLLDGVFAREEALSGCSERNFHALQFAESDARFPLARYRNAASSSGDGDSP